MRNSLLPLALGVLLLALNGCKKKEDVPPLSAKIQRIVPASILDDLKAKGLVVNEGNQPPNIEGIYLASPYRLLSPFGPDDSWQKGRVVADYKYRFYDQRGDDVKLDYKSGAGSDQASGVASFLAGSGDTFSLFGEQTGGSNGISYKEVSVVSGEITPTGIKNFQYAFVLTEKGPDPSDKLIAVGKSRIFEDGDALAAKTSAYRLAADGPTPNAVPGSLLQNQ